MRDLEYTVEQQYDGMEIRSYLRQIHGISSTLLIKLKKYEDGIRLNGVHARTIDKISSGDVLQLRLRETPQEFIPLEMDVPVLYESKDVIVYNKPPMMPCHPSKNHMTDTLANVFAWQCKERGESAAFRCINRLDRDTSGAVVVAKNRFAAAALMGKVEKEYTAVLTGVICPSEGFIEKPIYRPDPMRTERCVDERGQYSKTAYKTVCSGENACYVSCRLYTGRTHQIRVHMSSCGHPLMGDDMYGGSRDIIGRQALHCKSVCFVDPGTRETHTVFAPIPADMQRLIDAISAGKY